ncbi:uncharacterized protein A1O5_05707 [Cladophialophora psammophila CBS 110553]|uniref:Thiopurine S-methyltransferase n=1 Tax=Cladophialophora psammophila CBS 110553 TaxID=1182543 RepID=W9WR71_9EURO|nr:uncharacterized protein A1O5_05707 [Cladophialophora psammophila CBS 110553]EXJ70717.1 hypothetical protein A1O5_05707 [Cladophialophora psammophila CBS 110553]
MRRPHAVRKHTNFGSRAHSRDQKDTEGQNAAWSELWDTDQSDLWDRGKPSPALVDFVEQKLDQSLLQRTGDGQRRLKALVPGCGRGYDVVMLALHGFDAYGLEVSTTAVSAANVYAEAELSRHHYPSAEDALDQGHRRQPSVSHSHGTVKFVQGDFFKSDWTSSCLREGEIFQGFDLIYDYTFLCAIPPPLRRNWARRMQELLSPTGILVCLEFPLWKDLDAVGPPYGLNGVYWDLLADGGDGILHGSGLTGEKQAGQRGEEGPFKRVQYYKPDSSYSQGRGTDMVSVWKPSRPSS